MSKLTYLDFDLLIESLEGKYRARVIHSPAGLAEHVFDNPFTDQDLEIFYLRMGRPRQGVRRFDSPSMSLVKDYGERLFKTVLAEDIYACFFSSLTTALAEGKGLRLRLRITSPAMSVLPWEFLYNIRTNRFVSLSVETPLVRYLDLPYPPQALMVAPPLRILVMISSPGDFPALDVEEEWKKLNSAVSLLAKRGGVSLERLDDATLGNLQKKLRHNEYNIFHFIGHGGFDEQAQDGVLVFEDDANHSRPWSGQYIGQLLNDHRPMRLAVLNACEGAHAGTLDPFAGVAQSLVQQGLPAVIAMQFGITDQASLAFTQEFYATLADGYAIDGALSEARKAIFAQGNEIEWGTPVLYTRVLDGRIFEIAPPARQVEEEEKESGLPPEIEADKPIAAPEPAVVVIPEKTPAKESNLGLLIKKLKAVLQSQPKIAIGLVAALVIIAFGFIALPGILGPDPTPTLETFTATIPSTQANTPVFATDTEQVAMIPLPTETTPKTSTPEPPSTPTATQPVLVLASSATPTLTPTFGKGSTQISPIDGMVMVFIPEGEFQMGSSVEDASAIGDEIPQHKVFLDAYWIDQTEITNAMYRTCENAAVCDPPASVHSISRADYYQNPDYDDFPVIYVSWFNAKTYCQWAGRRLPSEAEWEKAARGDKFQLYPWGNSISCSQANYKDCVGDTTAVGSYPDFSSAWGIMDMVGNVWEWVADWYNGNYYSTYQANLWPPNPSGPDTGETRAMRGGSWGDLGITLRIANRLGNVPSYRDIYVGFRCAASADK